MVKNSSAMRDPLEEWPDNPLQYSCLENPHRQRSLVGYSPKGHKESDMTVTLSRPETKIHFKKCLRSLKFGGLP